MVSVLNGTKEGSWRERWAEPHTPFIKGGREESAKQKEIAVFERKLITASAAPYVGLSTAQQHETHGGNGSWEQDKSNIGTRGVIVMRKCSLRNSLSSRSAVFLWIISVLEKTREEFTEEFGLYLLRDLLFKPADAPPCMRGTVVVLHIFMLYTFGPLR